MSPREAFVDHLTLRVGDLEASRRFYAAALAPWGSREVEGDLGISFGPPGSEDVAIAEGEPSAPIHLALSAPDRETVERFYEAALAAGGRDTALRASGRSITPATTRPTCSTRIDRTL